MNDLKVRRIPFKAKLISNSIAQVINKTVSEIGLTSSQAFVLHFIHNHDSKNICQRDIECFFNIKHPTVIGIIKRLEEKELIVSVPSENDKRFKIIHETEKAKALNDKLAQQIVSAEENVLSPLSYDEQETLNMLLDKIISKLAPESLRPEFPSEEVK